METRLGSSEKLLDYETKEYKDETGQIYYSRAGYEDQSTTAQYSHSTQKI
jgi:hypothetical protein